MMIRRVEPTSAAHSVLKKGDVLLSFDKVDIGNDGTVPFRRGERISFSYLISQKYTGEEVMSHHCHVHELFCNQCVLTISHILVDCCACL